MTLKELLILSFDTFGIADYVYSLKPDQLEIVRMKLNALVAQISKDAVWLNWNSDAQLDDELGCPDYAIRALYLNLAVEIAPSLGKVVPATIEGKASAAMKIISRKAPPTLLTNTYAGSGNIRLNQCKMLRNPVQDDISNDHNSILEL